MGEILRRIGFVILSVISGTIVGVVVTMLFGLVKVLLGGSDGGVTVGDALVLGFGFFGAIGALLLGPMIGREHEKGKGRTPSRAGEAAGWIAGIAAGILCLAVFFRS